MASEGLNKVQLIGNLGLDPELKYTQGGQAVLRLRLATTEKWTEKGGNKQERTEWHTVILWGNRGEALSKFLEKGRTIYVEGRIQTREWEDKEGGKRSATEIVASNVLLLGGGGRREGEQRPQGEQRQQPSGGQRPAPQRSQYMPDPDPQNGADGEGFGDDIPF